MENLVERLNALFDYLANSQEDRELCGAFEAELCDKLVELGAIEPRVPKYFDRPTQIKFLDKEGNPYYGIAYKDEIICGCCGMIYALDEVKRVWCYDEWNDLQCEIYGSEDPN